MRSLLVISALLIVLPNLGCSPAVQIRPFQAIGSSQQASNTPMALQVTPQIPIVNVGQSIPVFAKGGTPPYTFTVLTADGGYFSENLFTATNVTGMIQAVVTDFKGKSQLFTIQVVPTH